MGDEDKNLIECKMTNVGAGIGGEYDNTQELKVMKFDEAMKTEDKENWEKAVNEDHKCILKYKVWEPVKKSEVSKDVKILTMGNEKEVQWDISC